MNTPPKPIGRSGAPPPLQLPPGEALLARVTHELRGPLNAILGLTEALLERSLGPLTERQAGALARIDGQGRQLLALVQDLLDVSELAAGLAQVERRPVSVRAVCDACAAAAGVEAARRGHTLAVEVDPEAWTVLADEARLRQLLGNLLDNAVKYTPNGGHVTLAVTCPGSRVRFEVLDTGVGMAPELLGRLFEPFVQLDRSLSRAESGTGLGLVLVRQLTHLLGGTIEVESTPGAGSRFTVEFPAGPPPSAPLRRP